MKFNSSHGLVTRTLACLRNVLLVGAAALLAACGGGGVTSTTASADAVFVQNPRALPAEYLARKAVAYSPFRTNDRDKEAVTDAYVKQDLDLLVKGDFRLIRLFDSSDKVAKKVLDVIVDNNLDVKVQLGAYVNTFATDRVPHPYRRAEIMAENEKELARAIALANNPKYQSVILAVSVGNETLVNWSSVPIDAKTLARYIKEVRSAIKQPVTTDDNFLAFVNPLPKLVVDQIDFVAIHLYPNIDTEYPNGDLYWDWKQTGVAAGAARATAMMNASMVELRRQYGMVRTALDAAGLHAMPMVITETGWNAVNKGKQTFRAHPVNQKMFYQRLEAFRVEGRKGAGPANVFYFEAFDEPWKQGDDGWGLFNLDRKARYVIQNLYPQTDWENPLLSDANAVYFDPPVVQAAVTTQKFVLFSDAPGASLASGLRVDAFDGDSVARDNAAGAPNEGVASMELTPKPKSYGWGLLWQPEPRADHTTPPVLPRFQNLSEFASAGKLNLWIKTDYPGKIELGLSTLTANGDSVEVFLPIGSGDYGYQNNNAWQLVSVPLQAFKAKNSSLDFRFVVNPFYISDVYSRTGNQAGATNKISIDGIHWSR